MTGKRGVGVLRGGSGVGGASAFFGGGELSGSTSLAYRTAPATNARLPFSSLLEKCAWAICPKHPGRHPDLRDSPVDKRHAGPSERSGRVRPARAMRVLQPRAKGTEPAA